MSQIMSETTIPAQEQFSYRPVPATAPVAFVLGLVSLLALLTEMILPLTIIGAVIGFLAVRRIRDFPNEYSGLWLAQSGMVLCVALIPSSIALRAYAYTTEVPEGYKRLSFKRDISSKGFIFDRGRNAFHPDVKALGDQSVFLKGYMLVKQQTDSVPEFLLCLDSGDCCFGGQPAVTDMIHIVATEDVAEFEYTTGMVYVAGKLKLLVPNPNGTQPAYRIEPTHFGPAKTIY